MHLAHSAPLLLPSPRKRRNALIALRALGVPVGAVSCITNFAAGIGQSELSHEEVEETAGRASPHFHELFRRWAVAISREKVAS